MPKQTFHNLPADKRERFIDSPQDALIRLADGREVLNMCANNYLGLADHPRVLLVPPRF